MTVMYKRKYEMISKIYTAKGTCPIEGNYSITAERPAHSQQFVAGQPRGGDNETRCDPQKGEFYKDNPHTPR